MTDYTKKQIEERLSKQREEFFRKRKFHFFNEKDGKLSKKLESDATVQKFSEIIKTFRPPVSSKQPATFAFYGSAEQYYTDAAYNIINYYPFDGTREEVMQWYLDAPQIDTALIRQFWPSSVGHLKLNYSEYVDFYAGPQSIQEAEFLGKLQKGESALQFGSEKGNTVEFWLKKEGFSESKEKETVVHIGTAPTYLTGASQADFKLFLSASSGNPFHLTYKSGSTGVENLQLAESTLTTGTMADSQWHHYSFRIDHSDSALKIKTYVDGKLDSTTTQSVGASIGIVDKYLKGRIGLDMRTADLTGSFSGSIDEVRFWKGKRTEEQISKFYDKKVYSSDITNKDYTSRLGMKFSFNKKKIGNDSKDSLVLDYSGNDVTGRIKNYSQTCRNSESAIDVSSVSINKETQDPVLDYEDPTAASLMNELKTIGKKYDSENNRSLKSYMPDWTQGTTKDSASNKEFELLMHLLATEFDTVKMSADSIRKMSTPEYQESFHITDPQLSSSAEIRSFSHTGHEDNYYSTNDYRIDHGLVSANEIDFPQRLVEELGINNPETMLLYLATPEEEVEGIVANQKLEKSIYETRNLLYKCLATSYSHVASRKGTQNSYRSILNTLAMGDEVISSNIIGTDAELKISDSKSDLSTLETKSISFSENNDACLYLDTSNPLQKTFIAADSTEAEYTFEGTFIFANKTRSQHNVLESSIFGIHQVAGTNGNLTVSSPDNASLQVSVVKESTSKDSAKFVLKSSSSIISELKTPLIYDLYNGQPWNIALRVVKSADNKFIPSPSDATYKIQLVGRCFIGSEMVESFLIESSITSTQAQNFQQANKTVYIGAQRPNITGSPTTLKSDIKVVDFNAWHTALSDSELEMRAKNPGIEGRALINESRNLSTARGSFKDLILRMSPVSLTGLNESNIAVLEDLSSGISDSIEKYGAIIGSQYNFKSTEFTTSLDNVIQSEFLSALRNIPIENLYGSDSVQIKNTDFNKFDIDSRPNLKILSFEKSMYRAISGEMMNFLGGVEGYNNMLRPVDVYRKSYKLLDHLRFMFFENVEDESQFERFVEYYRWIDKAIGGFLEQMVPASMLSNTGIENVVESHALERNKYDHKLSKFDTKDLSLSANLMSINELLYDWEHGHAPTNRAPATAEIVFNNVPSAGNTIVLKSTSGLTKTYTAASSFTVASGNFNRSAGIDTAGDTLAQCINHANGHNGEIIASYAAGSNTLTLIQRDSGLSGNKVITSNLTNVVAPAKFTGGSDLGPESSNCLWWKDRASRTSEINTAPTLGPNREVLRRVLTTEVTGSLHGDHFRGYVKRNLTKPYKLGSDRQLSLKLGSNRLANKLDFEVFSNIMNTGKQITLNSDEIYEFKKCDDLLVPASKREYSAKIDVTQTSGYLDGDADLILPFSLYSSSAGSTFETFKKGLVISNNHDDIPASLQSSWIREKIGGMPHRRVKFGSFDGLADGYQPDRPEAYDIDVSATQMTIKSPTNRSSMFHRDLSGARFYNISNIKTKLSDTRVLINGNYSKDYEIVQTTGRNINNTHLVETEGTYLTGSASLPTASMHVEGLIDRSLPNRTRREHVFVNKFSALGGPESDSDGSKDRPSGEFSIYSTVNYRNSLVRSVYDTLSKESSEKFGLRSGSLTQGSIHKTNRNPLRFTGSYGSEKTLDNFFVTHHLPQNDFGYSWITASVNESVYDFLNKNANIGHVHNFNISGNLKSSQTISFLQSSEKVTNLDFVGLNSFTARHLTASANQLGYSLGDLNSIILNRQGPYGWPTWKQIRGSEHPIARSHRKDNIFSVVFRTGAPFVSAYPGIASLIGTPEPESTVRMIPRETRNEKEIMATNRFRPINFSVHLLSDDFLSRAGSMDEIRLINSMNTQELQYKSWNYDSFFDSFGISPDGTVADAVDLPTFSNRFTIQNDVTKLANVPLQRSIALEEEDFRNHDNLKKLNFYIDQVEGDLAIPSVLREANYVEKIYPREVNTFTSDARIRSRFKFFGWNSKSESRKLILSGNLNYTNFDSLTNGSNQFVLYPEIKPTIQEEFFERSFFNNVQFVDLNSFDQTTSIHASTHITSSTWVLDARHDFSELPVNIKESYMSTGKSWMSTRDQGTRQEGILQNDYSVYTMGINNLYGAAPISPVYNRRVPHSFGANTFLAGEAQWDAGKGHSIGPFYDTYEKFSEELKTVGQQYSLIPEFCISRYSEDLLRKISEGQVNLEEEIEKIDDFLQVTGAVYHTSSADLQIGNKFFKTYSTSDFLKYFSDFNKNVDENEFDLKPFRLNLRCKATKRFLPYRGFYPAERAVQVSEIFARSYMNENFYTQRFLPGHTNIFTTTDKAKSALDKKIQNSRSQATKMLFGPGVLFNSIKAGVAVDYPIFSSSNGSFVQDVSTFYNNNNGMPISDFSTIATGSITCVTGSEVNSTLDTGIPRLSGSVSSRLSFDDLIDPSRLYKQKIYDNEPHPSASIFFGSAEQFSRVEYPFSFGCLDEDFTKRRNAAELQLSQAQFYKSMRPYHSAISNFTAQTVEFFLQNEKLQTIVSDPVEPLLTGKKTYKMRVYLLNNNTKMYDRHSAFGPPVDEGSPEFTKYSLDSADTGSTVATGSVDFTGKTAGNLADETVTFVDHNNLSKTYVFKQDISATSAVAATGFVQLDSLTLDGATFTLIDAESSPLTKTYEFETSAAAAAIAAFSDITINHPDSAKVLSAQSYFANTPANYPFLRVTDESSTLHTLRFYDSNGVSMTTIDSAANTTYINLYNTSASSYRTKTQLITAMKTALEAALAVSVTEPSSGVMRITLDATGVSSNAATTSGNCFLDSSSSPCSSGNNISNNSSLSGFSGGAALIPASEAISGGNIIININGMSTSAALAEMKSVINATASHDSSIVVVVDNSNNRVNLTQATAGTAGNNTINKGGSNSGNLTVNGFTGGAAAVSGTDFVTGQLLSTNVIVDVTGLSALSDLSSVLVTAITSTNGHNGTITQDGSFNSSTDVLTLKQGTAGTAGNKTNSSTISNFVDGFSGAIDSSTTPLRSLSPSTSTRQDSHGYLPYTPPFLDAGTAPYAEISFTPTSTRTYSVPEIIESSTVTYNNGIATSNPTKNCNYINAMQLSASVNLFSHVSLVSDNVEYVRRSEPDSEGSLLQEIRDPSLDKPRWVIQTKWETPVLDFTDSPASALRLDTNAVAMVTGSPWQTRLQSDYYQEKPPSAHPYLTASTGMWHQSGTVPSYAQGYFLTVTGPYTPALTAPASSTAPAGNLAAALGFLQETKTESGEYATFSPRSHKKVGVLAKEKEISEAIVAIPFYYDGDKEGPDIEFFELKEDQHSQAKVLNRSVRERHVQLLNMAGDNEERIERLNKGYRDFYDAYANPKGVSSIAYQIRMMEKFILPPHLDFVTNTNIKPHLQFFFQFKAKISQEQLQQLWQNLYPDTDYGIFKAQHSNIAPTPDQIKNSVESSDMEFLSTYLDVSPVIDFDPTALSSIKNPKNFLQKNVRWLIFKAKYRANSSYENLKLNSITHEENISQFNSVSQRTGRKLVSNQGPFQFNWPYDFFSIIEHAHLEAKVDFYSKIQASSPGTSQTPAPGPLVDNAVATERDAIEDRLTMHVSSYTDGQSNNSTGAEISTQHFTLLDSTSGASSVSNQLVVNQVIKSNEASSPSPANIFTIEVASGSSLKAGSESIYVNGVLQSPGSSNDYTISGTTITFAQNISNSSSVYVTYLKE